MKVNVSKGLQSSKEKLILAAPIEEQPPKISSIPSVSQRTVQLEDLVSTAKPINHKPIRDFFGRVVKVVEPIQTENLNGQSSVQIKKSVSHGVLFKFNEGYSNAVRKPLYLKDIF